MIQKTKQQRNIKYNTINDQTTTVINLPALVEAAPPTYKYK